MSNFLSVRHDFDVTMPRIEKKIFPEFEYAKHTPKLDEIVKETPVESVSSNTLQAPVAPTPTSLGEDTDIAQSVNSLLPLIKSMGGGYATPEATPPVNALADPTADISGAPLSGKEFSNILDIKGPEPTNALASTALGVDKTTDYWKTPVIGNMPLDKFVQLAGMTAHALDPTGFGGILGKNLAQYATTERDVESKNALAKLNMEHTTLANQKLKQEISEYPANVLAKRNQAATVERERQRKETRELLGDYDSSIDPTGSGYTTILEALKSRGIDVNLIPKLDAFKDSATGEFNAKEHKAWLDNYLATADQKAAAAIAGNKEKVGEKILYNKQDPTKTITVGYEKPKAGKVWSMPDDFKDNWTEVKPKELPAPRQPTPYSTFYTAGKAAGKSDEQIVTEWRVKEKAASAEDKVMMQVVDANGDLIWKKRSDIKSGEKVNTKEPRLTPQQLLDAETLIHSKGKDGIVLGAKPEGKSRVDAVNTHDTKGVIYRQVDKIEKGFFGGETKIPTLEKVQLPMINGEQVTGQDIYIAAKQSKGKYTFDQVYQKLLDKSKGAKK